MSLQLILGGSGSGKTGYLYEKMIGESMKHPQKQYLILVPEQFTMQTRKDIAELHPDHATMNIDIVSFQRLAYRVFEELAVENLEILDDMGKSMVLRKVASACRRELVLFSGHLDQAGFVSQLKSMLSEFYQYGITPQILREMVPLARTPLLGQKLSDFAAVFENFQGYIENHYITSEEVLDVLCRVVPQSELIGGSVIALDGFTGFTPVQYRLLEQFLGHAGQVIVTVTADRRVPLYEPVGIQSLFYMSSRMSRRLSELAVQQHVEKLEDIWLDRRPSWRYDGCPELDFLERNLFRYKKAQYPKDPGESIALYQAENPSAEVEYAAHQIQRLVREEGLRYRDMAVVTGDLAGYGKEVVYQFEQQKIPYFLDRKKDILDNPMVELIRAALEVIWKDFSYESVFRFLRTGLVTDDREMTDRMDNYVVALGISGQKRWTREWDRGYRGGGELNLKELMAFRDTVMAPLLAMREAFRQEDVRVRDMVQAVEQMLISCKIEEKMEAYETYFTDIGEYRMAKEYGQVYDLTSELFTRLKDLMGDEKVGRKVFIDILDAGFSEITVGVIPATVDRVVIGDITRTRLAHIKVLFFIGVNDGIIPARREGGSLLTDREREFFGEQDLELAPTAREDSFQQRFYLYLAKTKPSHMLMITWAGV